MEITLVFRAPGLAYLPILSPIDYIGLYRGYIGIMEKKMETTIL